MSHNRFDAYLDALEPHGVEDAALAQWRRDARERLARTELLEAYLDELEAPLAHQGLSAAERADWRTEARQHLLTLAHSHEELGAEPENALRDALSSFGEASFIGGEVGRQTRRINNRTGAFRIAAEAATAALAAAAALSALVFLSLGTAATTQLLNGATGRVALTGYTLAAALAAPLALRGDRRAWQVAGAVFGIFLMPLVASHAGMLPADLGSAASVRENWDVLSFHFYLYGFQAAAAGLFIWKKRSGALVSAFATAALDLTVTLVYWNITASQNDKGWIVNPAQLGGYGRVIFIMGGIQHFALGLLLSWGRKGAGGVWRGAQSRWRKRENSSASLVTTAR